MQRGPEHQRTVQRKQDGTTIRYAGSMEVETDAQGKQTVRTYWPMGIGLEIDTPDGSTQQRWLHTDRLGSVIGMTDETGQLVEQTAFDAWGHRRKLDGSAMIAISSSANPDHRGYTGQEMLDDLELVHMNGRVYDPLVARFISGDPLIQDPENGQNYSRYSYVYNNPTNLTDPTGFEVANGITVNSRICRTCIIEANKRAMAFLESLLERDALLLQRGFQVYGPRVVSRFAATTAAITAPLILIALPGNSFSDQKLYELDDLPGQAIHQDQGKTDDGSPSPEAGSKSGTKSGDGEETKGEDKSKEGSYTNTHESGKKYHGKGSEERAKKSGQEKADEHNDPLVESDWKPSRDRREAFKDEARRIRGDNGVKNPNNYNKINSPGEKYLGQDGE